MAAISCPHCGTLNRAGSKFCNQCGVNLDETPETDASTAAAVPVPALDETTDGKVEAEPAGPPAPRLAIRRPRSQRSPAPQPEPELLPESDPAQPWLRPEMDDADAATPPAPAAPEADRRLFAGLQGLLDPVEIQDPTPPLAVPQAPLGSKLDDQTRRHLRTLAGSGMDLADPAPAPTQPRPPIYHSGWIALLIGLALGLPVLLLASSPDLRPHVWPGLNAAHLAIAQLEMDSPVLVNWAYDPASAGEMDLVAQPVIEHLLTRRAQLIVVSQLPGGPATARKTIGQAATDLRRSAGLFFPTSGPQRPWVEGGFLPGGPSVLPLLGQDPAATVSGASLPSTPGGLSARAVSALDAQGPALAIVFAAQAEDVQTWLEQVQPLDATPVIAVVSAGADPILRPYLDSGQLIGLVSGFDGAFNYSQRLPHAPSAEQITRLQVQAVAQDWGMWIILLLILAGNLRGVLDRGASALGWDDPNEDGRRER